MKRNNSVFLPVLCLATCGAIGGQAVMDGVLLRNGDAFGLAIRRADSSLCAQRLRWRRFLPALQSIPLLRGFPILLETVANGMAAMNRSMSLRNGEEQAAGGFWRTVGSVLLAVALASLLFIGAPHVLSLAMRALDLSGDVDGMSFHLWDGLFKAAIFVLYVCLISLVPDIRRIFACHGAEHKVVGAWECQDQLSRGSCREMSRLHPRCGTTFVFFVVLISVAVQAAAIPPLFQLWPEHHFLARQGLAVAVKLALIVPVSGLAYELVRFAASLEEGLLAKIVQAPGLALQCLTTREPNGEQLDVALVALAEALGHEDADAVITPRYIHLADGENAPLGALS